MKSRAYMSRIGVEGALMVLSPMPFLFPFGQPDPSAYHWQVPVSSIAAVAVLVCAVTLFRKPIAGKIAGMTAAAGTFVSALPYIMTSPFVALTATILFMTAAFLVIDFRIRFQDDMKNNHVGRCRQRAWWGASMVPVSVAVPIFLGMQTSIVSSGISLISLGIAMFLFLHWSIESRSVRRILLILAGFVIVIASVLAFSFQHNVILALAMIYSLAVLLSFPRRKEPLEKREYWWEILLNHPARMLLTTFFVLCVAGTFLLVLPGSTQKGSIELVDAVFTSVSAVCVTGLIVLDTPNDFTLFGLFSIIGLIQLGGLGIMSIATVGMHAMGRRLSLKHERLLTSITQTDQKDLIYSLTLILKFTFIAECIGAVSLAVLFHASGEPLPQAAWRGIFTAVSAFCNAGFALQTDSLISYQNNPVILFTVSALIVTGGIAPATSLLTSRWLLGKPVPIPARIALVTTVVLLFSGTFFMMIFEWNGILAGLSAGDKIQNAWFHSVTLRTAGFNSVDISAVSNPVFLVMIVFMFIGGSPGGAAGGVKTTTIGILAMTFWANITNKNDVITQNRRIHFSTVYRAITIVVAGLFVWVLVVLMLEVTQLIPARDLVFEATSALGTVGLSTGATPLLDEIGKVIVIIAMFTGRIGPMTLFMLLGNERSASVSRCPEERISLT